MAITSEGNPGQKSDIANRAECMPVGLKLELSRTQGHQEQTFVPANPDKTPLAAVPPLTELLKTRAPKIPQLDRVLRAFLLFLPIGGLLASLAASLMG